MNFNPPREFVWFVLFDEIPSFFPFVRGSNLFRFIRFNWSTKKESKKLKNSHFGQIHVQPDFNTFSYSAFVMNEHSLWIHISQPSHWTALWTLRTAPLHRPQSTLLSVQYQSLLPVVSIFNKSSVIKSSAPKFKHFAWKWGEMSSYQKWTTNRISPPFHPDTCISGIPGKPKQREVLAGFGWNSPKNTKLWQVAACWFCWHYPF